jgi:hypothetical protein
VADFSGCTSISDLPAGSPSAIPTPGWLAPRGPRLTTSVLGAWAACRIWGRVPHPPRRRWMTPPPRPRRPLAPRWVAH